MIELAREQLIPVRDVPRHLPRRPNGKKVHVSACHRWVSRGVRGVKLEAIRVGGTLYTSIEALQRFGDELSAAYLPASTEAKTPRTREKQIDRAARALEEMLGAVRAPTEATSGSIHESPTNRDSQGERS